MKKLSLFKKSFLASLILHVLVFASFDFSLSLDQQKKQNKSQKLTKEQVESEMTKGEMQEVENINENIKTLNRLEKRLQGNSGLSALDKLLNEFNHYPPILSQDSINKLRGKFSNDKDEVINKARRRLEAAANLAKNFKSFIPQPKIMEVSLIDREESKQDSSNGDIFIKKEKKKKKPYEECKESKYVGIGLIIQSIQSSVEQGEVFIVAKDYPADDLNIKQGDIFLGMKKDGLFYPINQLVASQQTKEGDRVKVLFKQNGKVVEKDTTLRKICYNTLEEMNK